MMLYDVICMQTYHHFRWINPPCLLEKYPITIWLFKIATDNGTFTHDLYDDLPIENGDLLIYDELLSLNTQKKSDLLPLSSPFSTAFDAASCNFT